MPFLETHIKVDKIILDQEFPEVHKLIDYQWPRHNFILHRLWGHDPIFAFTKIYPKYGWKGVACYFLHVIVDYSPLMIVELWSGRDKIFKRNKIQ